MSDQPLGGITGGSAGAGNLAPAPLKKRFAADVIDLIIVPILLGVIFGFLLLMVDVGDTASEIVLGIVYVLWIFARDFWFSPGRWMVGLKLISTRSPGAPVTYLDVLKRNILLLPYILVVGYLVETVALFVKGERILDRFAGTRVVLTSS